MNFKKLFEVALIAFIFPLASAQAATLSTSGATGVEVGGALFDVTFANGSCIDVFDGCDEDSDFTFRTLAEAEAASDALLALIKLTPLIDDNPRLLHGCSAIVAGSQDPFAIVSCTTITPYDLLEIGLGTKLEVSALINYDTGSVPPPGVQNPYPYSPDTDLTLLTSVNFAVWTPSAAIPPVPLPAGGILMLSGLVGLTAIRRRKKRETLA